MRRNQSWLNENILSYDRVLDKHTINLVGGYTVQKAQNNLTSIETSKFGTDRFGTHNLSAGELPGIPATNFSEWSLLSYLGRLNYTFNGKYLLTLTARTDGSSTFGENNKWSFFPSAAVAWKLGNEPFIQNLGVFEQLKLRASYGITGNSGGPYKSIALLENTNYVYGGQLVIGYYPGGITNPDLRWETVSVLDLGLDMSFLRDRISVTADYYHKISKDLLLAVAVPSVSGYSTALLNAGSLENRGVEISANAVAVESPLKWIIGGNFSINRNKLLSLGDAREVIGTRVIGQPLGLILGYQYDGVFQNEEQLRAGPVQKGDVPGNARYVDQNGDGTINAEDRVIIGNTNPDFIYGLNNTLSYKNLELSLFLQGMYGHDVENLTYNVLSRMDPNTNQLRAVAQRRWTPENPDTDIPRAAFGTSNRVHLNSTRNIEKGSYLRVRSVRLTYNLNLARFFKTSRIYLSGQNVYTFTRYSGVNPELDREEYAYPLARLYTVGLELGF